MKTLFYLVILSVLFIFSCDELNKATNPSGENVIDKTVQVSTEDQIFKSGDDIEITFLANSLNGALELKVSKESSHPEFNILDYKLGSNIFKIKFKGNAVFKKVVRISINYDPSKIKAGKSIYDIIKPFYHQNNMWKILSDYYFDESNHKIIFKFSTFDNKIDKKASDELMDSEGEIIIGPAYSNTDTGQNDDTLKLYNEMSVNLTMGCDRFQWSSKNPNKGKSDITFPFYNVFKLNYISNGKFDVGYMENGNFITIGYIQLSQNRLSIIEFNYEKIDLSNKENGDIYKYKNKFILANLPEKHDAMDDRGYWSFGFKPSGMFKIYYPCSKNYVTYFEHYDERYYSSYSETNYDQILFNCEVCDKQTEESKKGKDVEMCSIEVNLIKR